MRLFHFDYHFCFWAAEIIGAISGRQTEKHGSDNWLIMSQQSGFLHWHHNIIYTLGPVLYSGLSTVSRVKFSPPLMLKGISASPEQIARFAWLSNCMQIQWLPNIWKDNSQTSATALFQKIQYSGLVQCVCFTFGLYRMQVNAIKILVQLCQHVGKYLQPSTTFTTQIKFYLIAWARQINGWSCKIKGQTRRKGNIINGWMDGWMIDIDIF